MNKVNEWLSQIFIDIIILIFKNLKFLEKELNLNIYMYTSIYILKKYILIFLIVNNIIMNKTYILINFYNFKKK